MQRYDKNGSGVLEKDEWKQFRTDPSPGDTNKDGKLTKDELTKWMSSRFGQSRGGDSSSGRSGRGSSGGDSDRGRFSGRGDSGGRSRGGDSGGRGRGGDSGGRSRGGSSSQPDTPDSYRFKTVGERLPEGLPDWFKENDADGDGQIMMSEYAKNWDAKMLDSFDKFDFDADGVITPQECLDGIDEGAKYGADSSRRSSDRGSSERSSDDGDDKQSSSEKNSSSNSRYAKWFQTFDSDKSGVLEKEEWSKNKYIKPDFDVNGDGKLTLEELSNGFAKKK